MTFAKFISPILLLTIVSCTDKNENVDVDNEIENEIEVFHLDFESNNIGTYDKGNLSADIGETVWSIIDDRANIEVDTDHGKVLKVIYPENAVGPQQGGIQFVKSLPKTEEYYLDYYLKFKEGFDFALGGKLPGLTSGGSEFTGGVRPENGEGWSARYMWVNEGEIIVYFYYMDMKSQFGDAVKLNTFFETGKWYRITQHIKLNDADESNGVMEVWVDGNKLLDDQNVRYRIAPQGEIDSFYFSTFHGGSTTEWAPGNDSYIFYDDFSITNTKPIDLN